MPVHLFGRPAPLAELAALGLPLLEDAAQAFGAPGIATTGVCSTFSFFPTKNLFALGDGGLVACTDDDGRGHACASCASTARATSRRSSSSATNSRLDAIQAAALRVFLPAPRRLEPRAPRGGRPLRRARARRRPSSCPRTSAGHVYHMYVVRTPERDRIAATPPARPGSRPRRTTCAPLHLQPAMAYLGYAAGLAPRDRARRRGEPRAADVGRDRRRAAGAGRRRRSAPRPASPSRQRAPCAARSTATRSGRSPSTRRSSRLAWWLAWILRFDEARPVYYDRYLDWSRSSLLVVGIKLPVFVFSGFYNRWWRYVSTRDMWTVLRGVVLASIAVFLVFTLFDVHRAAVPARRLVHRPAPLPRVRRGLAAARADADRAAAARVAGAARR